MSDTAREITVPLESLGYSPASELGRGGMGIVLLAQQKSLSRLVAIKILLAQAADDVLIGCFQREGRVYKDLSHPSTRYIQPRYVQAPVRRVRGSRKDDRGIPGARASRRAPLQLSEGPT